MKNIILTVTLFFLFSITYAQPGEPDSSFGNNGIVTNDSALYFATAVQSDGKLVVAGTSNNRFAVARYNINGTLDSSFSEDGVQTSDLGGSAISVAIQSDGKIVAAGGSNGFAVARYNIDGSPDNTFSGDGQQLYNVGAAYTFAQSVAIQDDGKIVVAGYSSTSAVNNSDFTVARLNVDGTLDITFSNDGKQTTDFGNDYDDIIYSVAIQPDGKIVAAGHTGDYIHNYFAVARYNSDGSLDNTFDGDGKQTTDFGYSADGYSLVLQNDGKILVAGQVLNATYDFAIARYNTDGSPDNAFSDDGKQTTTFGDRNPAEARSIVIQSNGKIIIGGDVNNEDGKPQQFALARYNSDGTLDSTFSGDGKQTTQATVFDNLIFSLAIANNKLYAAGVGSDGQFLPNYGVLARYFLDEENNAPTVTLTIPHNIIKYTAPARIKFNATATDENGTITKVRFYSGTKHIHTETVFPYGFLWDNVPAGIYTITAVAFDNDGNQTTSNSIEVSVVDENVPPMVSIVTPVDDTTYTGPATIHIIANAKDPNDKISKVEFYNGTSLLTTEYYYPYTYTWNNVQPGTYTLTANATDDKGLSATSDPVTITVTAPNALMASSKLSLSRNPKLNDVSVKLNPNPAGNTLQIFTKGLQNKSSTISVISVSGVVLKTIQRTSNQIMQMDVSSLSPGVYFLKVLNGGKILYTQFVKL